MTCTGTRRDGTRVPPRSSGRNSGRKGRDRRGAPHAQPNTPATPTDREQPQDSAYATRRLDVGWSDGGYQ